MKKSFIFLYPQQEIFIHEVDRGSVFYKGIKKEDSYFIQKLAAASTKEQKDAIRREAKAALLNKYKAFYSAKLNSCIHHRYRRNGFSIYYAMLDDSQISDVISLHKDDSVIFVGMDSATHRTKRPDGTYPYPRPDFILDQLLPVDVLRVAGFHMWDCVEKLARRAHKRGIDVMVDEDLTEFFSGRLKDRDFRVKTYPTYDPRQHQGNMFDMFMAARKNKPWLFQEY